MNIEDVKIGTRVVCLNDSSGAIPKGAFGIVIEDGDDCPSVSWEKRFSKEQYNHMGYSNVYALMLNKIEKVSESFVPEKETAKLTVTISDEDKNDIAKDILKIVFKDLNVIITDAIDSLSNDSLSDDTLSDDKDDELAGFDFSDEKLQQLLDEATKDVMKEIIRGQITSLNKQDSTI